MSALTHHRSTILTCMLLTVVGLGLPACSSSVSRNGAATTEATAVETTDATTETTTGGGTATTKAPTTTTAATTTTARPPATTAKPPATTQPAGPTTKTVTAAKTTWTCAEANAAGNVIKVSWTTSGAVSVIIGIENPGEFATGPANGSTDIPATCNDTQNVYVTPVDSNGKKGTPKTLLLTILAP